MSLGRAIALIPDTMSGPKQSDANAMAFGNEVELRVRQQGRLDTLEATVRVLNVTALREVF